MKKGKLIIVESGTDGSGKATQSQRLYDRLILEGENVRKITFPNYDSPACTPVKMYLNGEFGKNAEDINAYAASTFYAIDRFASFKTDWGNFYNSGGIIISDRYVTSNMVHQAVKMNDNQERETYLDWLYDLEYNKYGLPIPDCVIFLDLSPDISEQLMKDRVNKFTGEEEKDIHEGNKKYLVNCYNNSLNIVNKYEWNRIKCDNGEVIRSIEDISEEVYEVVKKYI
ncbi:MAG: thymidylate kinase [Terrisporobacter sp.]|uniref:dTMP kinase n=1 Tax=Clostridia TaxID=186801 RepID=UPI002FCAA3F2